MHGCEPFAEAISPTAKWNYVEESTRGNANWTRRNGGPSFAVFPRAPVKAAADSLPRHSAKPSRGLGNLAWAAGNIARLPDRSSYRRFWRENGSDGVWLGKRAILVAIVNASE
jgi:hypothetical protein